jgi:uncharacterized membrane protein (UPF0136 family)
MHRQTYQKLLFHLSLFGIAISILVGFSDVIFGSLWEFFHLIFEVIEMALDRLIEDFFETDLHDTQTIVFYIMLVIGGILIYFVRKALVHLFSGVDRNLKHEWTELRTAIAEDWRGMSMTNRVIWISVLILVNYLASFFLF